MTTLQWLERNAHGFAELSADERNLIMHFSLLWSLFEGEVLNASANVATIEQAVRRWDQAGLLTTQTFLNEFNYFQERYVKDGKFTCRFPHLHLRGNDQPTVVQDALLGNRATPRDIGFVVLIIVFRFRNNLFHGEKWVYELREQDQNFSHANAILVRAIELNRIMPQAGTGRS
jgi:hypothetical protein